MKAGMLEDLNHRSTLLGETIISSILDADFSQEGKNTLYEVRYDIIAVFWSFIHTMPCIKCTSAST